MNIKNSTLRKRLLNLLTDKISEYPTIISKGIEYSWIIEDEEFLINGIIHDGYCNSLEKFIELCYLYDSGFYLPLD